MPIGVYPKCEDIRIFTTPWRASGLASPARLPVDQRAERAKGDDEQQAGLAPGDLVLAVDGVTVATLEAFYKKLWDRAQPDAEVSLTVVQGATLRTIVVKPVDRSSTMRKPAGI